MDRLHSFSSTSANYVSFRSAKVGLYTFIVLGAAYGLYKIFNAFVRRESPPKPKELPKPPKPEETLTTFQRPTSSVIMGNTPIPPDVLEIIASYLDLASLYSFSQVCKALTPLAPLAIFKKAFSLEPPPERTFIWSTFRDDKLRIYDAIEGRVQKLWITQNNEASLVLDQSLSMRFQDFSFQDIRSGHLAQLHACHWYSLGTVNHASPIELIEEVKKVINEPIFKTDSYSIKLTTDTTLCIELSSGDKFTIQEPEVMSMDIAFVDKRWLIRFINSIWGSGPSICKITEFPSKASDTWTPAATNKIKYEVKRPFNIKSYQVINDQILAVGYEDGVLRMWDLSTGKPIGILKLDQPILDMTVLNRKLWLACTRSVFMVDLPQKHQFISK